MLDGKLTMHAQKELFVISEQYPVSRSFVYNHGLKELQQIRRGDIIGYNSRKPVKAAYSFYPLFLHNGRYEGTFAVAAKRKKIVVL